MFGGKQQVVGTCRLAGLKAQLMGQGGRVCGDLVETGYDTQGGESGERLRCIQLSGFLRL